ncbi:McrB family protein [Buttiauxella gaviniae]|uniref:McrB family protein n=1 Tax=Buttiauxella gaviniae TaxID=82990 RepID=UPI003BB66FA5
MSNFSTYYTHWDEFLSVWPPSRLVKMTLEEYSQAGSKDSFTYWIESRLDELGSIWGGSAFKFGVFSRKDTEKKNSDVQRSYSETHGWYTTLGNTAQEAFEKVRGFIVQVADWAENGELDSIDAFPYLGEAFKWKIAFHYQNRQSPTIVATFTRAPLAVFVGCTSNQSMAELQKEALAKHPNGMGILEFGRQIWEVWSKKNLLIYKLSHGMSDFSLEEWHQYLQSKVGVMYGDTGKGQGKAFQDVKVGTLFYLCYGNEMLSLIGQFTSQPEPCSDAEGWLQRHYRVLKTSIRSGGYEGAQKGWAPNYRSTFKRVPVKDLPEFDVSILQPFFGIDLAELAALAGEPTEQAFKVDQSKPQSEFKFPQNKMKKSTASCFNRIYYGPPGTGKTYTLMQLLKSEYEPKMDSISAGEWYNQFIVENFSSLKWWEGVAAALYELGGKANLAELYKHPFIKAIHGGKTGSFGSSRVRDTLQKHTVEYSTTIKMKAMLSPFIFDKNAQSEWILTGEWEESCLDIIALVETLKQGLKHNEAVRCYSFVTFHQSYGYEEFVEGLRPVLNGDGESSEVEYEIRPGVFKELCLRARQSPEQRFAMVIDEVNRGNISKIFGELITLIETDKRDPMDGSPPPLELTLAYSGDKFSVPANVDIIGTMNTADRSLALLDTALRRRFDFIPLLPDTRAEKHLDEPNSAPLANLDVTTDAGKIDIRLLLERINERIEVLYDKDHCIGHSYFTPLSVVADGTERFELLGKIFQHRIIPLLEEYFFEDWHKIRLVLGDNQKDNSAQFITINDPQESGLDALFGQDHGLDSYSTRRSYCMETLAFRNPTAYITIYQKTV